MSVLCIGEMLIDFIGDGVGAIDKVHAFRKKAGGSVANVACVTQKLGYESFLLTTLGEDGFGDFLENTLQQEGVNTKYVTRKNDTFTPLAFVALDETGDRSFSFYFKGSSALRISENDVNKVDLSEINVVHFASIAIQEESKQSHHTLLKKAKEQGKLISFDVNLRFNLWEDEKIYLETIKEFLPYVDVLKVADNELEFLTGKTDIKEALKDDFSHIKFVLYTKGEEGSEVYYNDFSVVTEIPDVQAIDTTGAGDAFAGSFLAKLLNHNNLDEVTKEELEEMAHFATNYASLTTTKVGAISSYITEQEYNELIK